MCSDNNDSKAGTARPLPFSMGGRPPAPNTDGRGALSPNADGGVRFRRFRLCHADGRRPIRPHADGRPPFVPPRRRKGSVCPLRRRKVPNFAPPRRRKAPVGSRAGRLRRRRSSGGVEIAEPEKSEPFRWRGEETGAFRRRGGGGAWRSGAFRRRGGKTEGFRRCLRSGGTLFLLAFAYVRELREQSRVVVASARRQDFLFHYFIGYCTHVYSPAGKLLLPIADTHFLRARKD